MNEWTDKGEWIGLTGMTGFGPKYEYKKHDNIIEFIGDNGMAQYTIGEGKAARYIEGSSEINAKSGKSVFRMTVVNKLTDEILVPDTVLIAKNMGRARLKMVAMLVENHGVSSATVEDMWIGTTLIGEM